MYGGYPYLQSLGSNLDKQRYLEHLADDYLLKDLFDLKEVGDPDIPKKLLSLLAYQIGNQVSLRELATQLSISVKTVARYLTLLEKIFVIFPMGTYSTNLRSELAKSKKYYFYDLGIRNAVIRQFGTLESRTDVGALWENFMILERAKKHEYQNALVDRYFWRNYAQREVDLVERTSLDLAAYEFKWGAKKPAKTPKFFKDSYTLDVQTINPDNFEEFI
jgi:predicted AAA+ superfamily ATPase